MLAPKRCHREERGERCRRDRVRPARPLQPPWGRPERETLRPRSALLRCGGEDRARAPPSPRRAPGRRGVMLPVHPMELRCCPFSSRGGGGDSRADGELFHFLFLLLSLFGQRWCLFSPLVGGLCGKTRHPAAPQPPGAAHPNPCRVPALGDSRAAHPGPLPAPSPLPALSQFSLYKLCISNTLGKKKNEEKQPTSLASHNKPALSWLTTQLCAAVKSFWEARRCL